MNLTEWTGNARIFSLPASTFIQQLSTLNISTSLHLFLHSTEIRHNSVMWGYTKRLKSPRTVRTFSIDVRYSVNMSEPRVKRIKTCLPLCKTHLSTAGSQVRQNFPTVVEESLCGVSNFLMEVSYRLEALVRTLL